MPATIEGTPQTAPGRNPRSVEIAKEGIRSASEFSALMSALMSDVLSGEITPGICNAAVNAGGKLLKVVEMQHRYGVATGDGSEKDLILCKTDPNDPVESRINRIEEDLKKLRNGRLAGRQVAATAE